MELAAPKPIVASFTRRSVAYAVDVLIAAVAVQLIQGALFLAFGDPRQNLEGGAQWFAYMWCTVSAPIYAYFTLMESSRWRATLGKRAFGLQVTTVYGARVSLPRAFVRTAVKLAPWDLTHAVLCFPAPPWDGGPAVELRRGIFLVYALVGAYLATTLMTRQKQSVHDLVVGTLVVRDARSIATTARA